MTKIAISWDRRGVLRLIAGGVSAGVFIKTSRALSQDAILVPDVVRPVLVEAMGGWELQPGRVSIDLPVIAETGLSVPIGLSVDSPMTETDHVRRIMAFAPGNPEPVMADYLFGPRAGIAHVASRVRIAQSQTILAAALMNDGSRWGAAFTIMVTRGACVAEVFLPDMQAIQDRARARGETP